MMHALSVRQPWAELIASGRKKIEYRTWKVSVRGDLLIAASASRHDDDCTDEGLDPERLAYGVALCIVDFWKVSSKDGNYCWHLRNVRRVEPLPVKGAAALYKVDDKLIRFADPTRAAVDVSARPQKREPSARISGAPTVLVAVRDARLAKRWTLSLRDLGCVVTSVPDGYSAWLHLKATPFECLLVDAEVGGYTAPDLLTRMRETQPHQRTPVIFAGRSELSDPSSSCVRRAASAGEVARAVEAALSNR